ncbi:MAG: hypothetical protein O2923_11165 [Verrucomicrobia bacterium]|nr:hypothetical protein [Verrucomicrobiota bacterium]
MIARRSGLWRRLAVTAVAFGTAFVVADTMYRVYARNTHGDRKDPRWDLYYHDDVLGANWHHTNSTAILSWRATAPHRVSFNKFGCRGTSPITLEKPTNTVRIIVLGGSSTENPFVGDGDTWPEKLEQKLNAASEGVRVEVINLGAIGFTMARSVRNLELRGLLFSPDIVITYHAFNDFIQGFSRKYRARLNWQENYQDYEGRQVSDLEGLLCKSAILDRLGREWYYRRGRRREEYLLRYWRAPVHVNPAVEGVEDDFIQSLAALKKMTDQHGCKLVVAIQANAVRSQPSQDLITRDYDLFSNTLDGQCIDWDVYVRGFAHMRHAQIKFAELAGVDWIDVEARVSKDLKHFIDLVHLTDTGTEAVATALGDALLRRGLVTHSDPGTRW